MGILPTFYAHWRLNAMVRSWRKLDGICRQLLKFSEKYADPADTDNLAAIFKSLRGQLDEVIEKYESRVLADLKERV